MSVNVATMPVGRPETVLSGRLGDRQPSSSTRARKTTPSRNRTDWQPSGAQERLLYVFWDYDYQIPITRACTEARIGRQTYSDWTHDPRFNRWWAEHIERFFAMNLDRVYAAMLKAAIGDGVGGSNHARRLYLQRFDPDYRPRRKAEAQHTVSFEEGLAELLSDDDNGED